MLDVKVGSGAFMARPEDARALAQSLVETANGAGCKTSALITDMDQPLGLYAGNALEVIEVMETLTGSAISGALWDVTTALGGEALWLAGLADSAEQGGERIDAVLEDGRAAEVFGRMVAALGGPADFVERYPDRLPAAPVMKVVEAPRAGFVCSIDTRAIGEAVVHLGGGRLVGTDKINPSVGLAEMRMIGEALGRGDPLMTIHASDAARADAAEQAVLAAYGFSDDAPDEPPLIHERIGA